MSPISQFFYKWDKWYWEPGDVLEPYVSRNERRKCQHYKKVKVGKNCPSNNFSKNCFEKQHMGWLWTKISLLFVPDNAIISRCSWVKLFLETTYTVSVTFGYIIVLQTNPKLVFQSCSPWRSAALCNLIIIPTA